MKFLDFFPQKTTPNDYYKVSPLYLFLTMFGKKELL